jgi:hypothetical protein
MGSLQLFEVYKYFRAHESGHDTFPPSHVSYPVDLCPDPLRRPLNFGTKM